jgi:hypothetical protein
MESLMPTPAARNDPLADFLKRFSEERELTPIPLVETRIDVAIRGGLATVSTERTFRNSERHSIEAAMTFPLPVDATLCALSARFGDRTVKAIAEISKKAREKYEDAVSEGKSAVLHEEPLKGIHVLSVAHVAPGAEIMVSDTWTALLSFNDLTPRLHIPTGVGEIYGLSPLPPSDDIVLGNAVQKASIGIACASGTATLMSPSAADRGRFIVRLNRPIDIVIDGWKEETLHGRTADGRKVTLDIKPAAKADANLDVGVLFDHSGSMNEEVSGDPAVRQTKFDVARTALLAIGKERFGPADRMQLWEFNDQVDFIGEANGAAAVAIIERLHSPAGGTEIGLAIETVIDSGRTKNLVIVTDGKSWAFDPQAFARSGIRVTAVLIGEDALEARIAHLAAMTGGQAFIAAGADAATAIAAALDAARLPHEPPAPISKLTRVAALRRGARVVATWGVTTKSAAPEAERQIGATAAALAVPLLDERAAAALAKREGIVTHLTSLILVDQEGERCGEIPARRKVPLDWRRVGAVRAFGAAPTRMYQHAGGTLNDRMGTSLAPIALGGPEKLEIDWDADPESLRRGDLSQLCPDKAEAIRKAAQGQAIVALATALGLDPIVVVIALFARAEIMNRSAQRLSRAVLGAMPYAAIAGAMSELGL